MECVFQLYGGTSINNYLIWSIDFKSKSFNISLIVECVEKVLGCNIVFWSPFDLIFLLNLQYGSPYTYMPLTLTQMFQRFRKTFQLESWGAKLRKKNNSSEWCFLFAKLLHLKYTTYKGNTWITKVLAGLWKHWHFWQFKSQCIKTKHTNGKLHTKTIHFFGRRGAVQIYISNNVISFLENYFVCCNH